MIDHFYEAYVRRFNPSSHAEPWLAAPPHLRKQLPALLPHPPAVALLQEQLVLPNMTDGAKNAVLMKKMLAAWGEPTVTRLIDLMFGEARFEPRVMRSNQDVGAFYAMAQFLLLRDHRVDDRTAERLDAAQRSTRPR